MSNEIIRSDVLYVPKINCCLSCRTMPILGEIRESKIKLATLREVEDRMGVLQVTANMSWRDCWDRLYDELKAKIKEAEKHGK